MPTRLDIPRLGRRLRLRTDLLEIAAIATGLAASRSILEGLVFCRERSDFYEARSNRLDVHAKWAGLAAGAGARPGPVPIERMRSGAAESRDSAAFYRAAAGRPWLRLPDEPSKRAAGRPILPCPDDITAEPPETPRDDPCNSPG